METVRKYAEKIDHIVFQIERFLTVISVLMMTLLVSIDVIQRTFSRPVGKTASMILSLIPNPSEQTTQMIQNTVGPAVFILGSLVLCVLAARSSQTISNPQTAPSWLKTVAMGISIWVIFTLVIQLILWLFPTSVPGAQKFALGFMLWSGMLGASLATRTRRHIALDTVKKNLDTSVQKPFALLGGIVTGGFCLLLTILAWMEFSGQYHEWATNEGVGVFDAVPIPTWTVTLCLPLTFGMMAARFFAQGVHDFVWGAPTGGMDAHGIDLEALEKEPVLETVTDPTQAAHS